MYVAGQTLNTMTLGGFALAVGILVDNGTVVIENIERHVACESRCPGHRHGAGEVGVPTLLSTLCICIVFVPVFLLQGTAKYLFSPLSLSVIVSLLASLALSFTMVPVLFKLPDAPRRARHSWRSSGRPARTRARRLNLLHAHPLGFERGFERSARVLSQRWPGRCPRRAARHQGFFGILIVVRCCCSRSSAGISSRRWMPADAPARARAPGHALERPRPISPRSKPQIRKLVGSDQIDVILDNIGLPYSGINIALSDSATVGPMDGEILIS
jgi:multidrug efflux pump subunit AcrB